MLLCAGLGVRVRPLTYEIPKPVLPLFGRTVAEYHLEMFAEAGMEAAVLNLHHKPEAIKDRLGARCRGVDIYYSREPEILGPTGGIRKALPLLGDGPVLVVNGDIVFEYDVKEILKYHEETGAALTFVVGPGRDRPALRAVGVDADSRVRQLWGKPGWEGGPLACMVNLGVFVYERRIIEEYIPGNSFYHFRDALIPALFERGEKIMAYAADSYWNDIGTVEAYIQAHLDVFGGGGTSRCRAAAAAGMPAPGAGFHAPYYIEGGLKLGEGASVGPNVACYAGCEIGGGARLTNSVVMPGARVPRGAASDRAAALGGALVYTGEKKKNSD
jgi:mannose-1-phosphate guanylyltransferase